MNQIKEIFTVTSTGPFPTDTHCFGWFPTLPEAELAVAQNYGSMSQDIGNNEFIVIEKCKTGVLTWCDAVAWYKFEDGKWVKYQAPEWSIRFCNWAMG